MSAPDLTSSMQEGRITDEAVARARDMIGVILRPEGPYLQDATADTLRNFCNGIGDRNPLYRDAEYGRSSRFGGLVAHPMFPYAFGWPGRSRWGLPGVHGFYAGNDWEFYRNVRPGERISCIERVVGVEEKQGRFSGRLIVQHVEASYLNPRDELIARVLGWTTRHERQAARERSQQKASERYEYRESELERIEAAVVEEPGKIRGARPRYWEDVQEGELVEPIARGPLSLMDTMGFLVGCGRGHTHGVLMDAVQRHPGHYFRNPEAGAGVEYTGIGHHRDSAAQQIGVAGAYDYGPQRTAWICSLVTNWMGDAAFLKRLRADMRGFNLVGDTTWCKGRVQRTYVKDGHGLVDLEVWAENQRGQITAPGLATVVLPSRNIATKPVVDGSAFDLELPTIR